MCRQDWTITYWLCKCTKTSFLQLIADDGCGFCGTPSGAERLVNATTERVPCERCVADGRWIKTDHVWRAREAAIALGGK